MASPVDTWMPLYIGDVLSETIGMTLEERGAYVWLNMSLWKSGGSLPFDVPRLARAIGVDRATFDRIWPSIEPVYSVVDGTIRSPRIDAHMERALKAHRSLSERGRAGASKRWDGRAIAELSPGQGQAMADDAPSPSQLHAPIASQPEELPSVPASPDVTEWSLRMMDQVRAMTIAWRGTYPKPLADAQYPKTQRQGADAIGKIVRLDGHPEAEVEATLAWLAAEIPQKGFCWREQVQSGAGLREKWDRIQDARRRPAPEAKPETKRMYDPSKGSYEVSVAEANRIEREKERARVDRQSAGYAERLSGWRQRLNLGADVPDEEVMRQAKAAVASKQIQAPRANDPAPIGSLIGGIFK